MNRTESKDIDTGRGLVEALERTRVLAIVRGLYTVDEYLAIVRALVAAGLYTVELTIEQPNALAAIEELDRTFGDEIWLGAGTVRSAQAAEQAFDAGARYLVSPGFVAGVADVARQAGKPYLPGVLTASEIETAVAAGCSTVKLFPAEPLGPSYLEALTAPLQGVRFVVTGGVNSGNAREFLRAGALAVGMGGSLVGKDDEPVEIEARAFRLLGSLQEARKGA